jgi:hypothetical protein
LNVAHAGRFEIANVSVSPSASAAVGRKANALPAFTEVDGVPLIVGARFGVLATVTANGASAVLILPSLTLMTMFEYVPTFVADGVPISWPVTLLNVAHIGRFWMLKPSVLLSASAAVGRKLYACPAVTEVDGAPLIVGALLAEPVTVSVNGVSPTPTLPSLTRIWMFEYVPTLAAVGVPDNTPVALLKVIHAGRLTMAKRSGSRFSSLAVGAKRYAAPTATDVAGVPEMTGATLWRRAARIENSSGELELVPSLTVMRMSYHCPTTVGVPLSTPVDVENVAHDGRF